MPRGNSRCNCARYTRCSRAPFVIKVAHRLTIQLYTERYILYSFFFPIFIKYTNYELRDECILHAKAYRFRLFRSILTTEEIRARRSNSLQSSYRQNIRGCVITLVDLVICFGVIMSVSFNGKRRRRYPFGRFVLLVAVLARKVRNTLKNVLISDVKIIYGRNIVLTI